MPNMPIYVYVKANPDADDCLQDACDAYLEDRPRVEDWAELARSRGLVELNRADLVARGRQLAALVAAPFDRTTRQPARRKVQRP